MRLPKWLLLRKPAEPEPILATRFERFDGEPLEGTVTVTDSATGRVVFSGPLVDGYFRPDLAPTPVLPSPPAGSEQ